MKIILALTLAPVLGVASPAAAQTSQNGGLGGLARLLGGALPNIASTSAGNAAGVLGYCVKNNVLSGANATSVLERLTGQPGVTSAPGYAAGEAGTLQSGRKALSLDSVKGQIRTRLCDLVLKRAGSFL